MRTLARKKRNIIRFPNGIHLNVGIVIFIFIAVYIAFNVYNYFSAVQIGIYEVEQGTIEVNTSYTGLILRQETVITAQQTGKLDYYLKDNTKAANGTLICSVDENGNVSDKISAAANDASAVLAEENLTDIQNSVYEYMKVYDDGNFYQTYNFKSDISGKLMEAMNLGALDAVSDYTDYARDNRTFHLYYAAQPGIVAYYTDGYESYTTDRITADIFNQSDYQKKSLKTSGEVQSGEPVYKLITDENWQIVVPIDETMRDTLADGEVTEISFKEDDTTAWADYTIEKRDGQFYLILNLRNSMIRYAYERFIDINILLDQQTGLKIPNSAITVKTFDLVPNDYFTKGNDSDTSGLLVERLLEDGTYGKAEFVPVTVYYQTEDKSYISQDNIKQGDLIVKTDSTERYEIAETDRLKGVYNVNKGYAVFKQIVELYHNDDYTIVESGTDYGIALYDHIALEGSTLNEDQMIVQ